MRHIRYSTLTKREMDLASCNVMCDTDMHNACARAKKCNMQLCEYDKARIAGRSLYSKPSMGYSKKNMAKVLKWAEEVHAIVDVWRTDQYKRCRKVVITVVVKK